MRGKAMFFTLDPATPRRKSATSTPPATRLTSCCRMSFRGAVRATRKRHRRESSIRRGLYRRTRWRCSDRRRNQRSRPKKPLCFGAGATAKIKPWMNDAAIGHLGTQDAGTLLVGGRIKLANSRWKGTTAGSIDDLINIIYNDGTQGIGIVPTTVADRRRAELRRSGSRPLVKRRIFPDRRSTTYDKQSVRDGHYPLWGFLHTILRQDPETPGQPLSKKGARLADIFLGKTQVGGQDSQLCGSKAVSFRSARCASPRPATARR